ncbi:helix-turn-helix domain-containing protein [Streptomyces sp. NPDC059851]|uniref:helix-turn-helix domain-containing protein n=1 Tax=Streptomyces sp. NPDC059851 TaxID=3346971 RepID=UPI00366816AD
MQAAELLEQEVKPPEVAQRLRVSRKSAYRWHQLGPDGGMAGLRLWPRVDRVDRGVGCRRTAWRSWRGFGRRGRPRTAGWRTRCGPPPWWPR